MNLWPVEHFFERRYVSLILIKISLILISRFEMTIETIKASSSASILIKMTSEVLEAATDEVENTIH